MILLRLKVSKDISFLITTTTLRGRIFTCQRVPLVNYAEAAEVTLTGKLCIMLSKRSFGGPAARQVIQYDHTCGSGRKLAWVVVGINLVGGELYELLT